MVVALSSSAARHLIPRWSRKECALPPLSCPHSQSSLWLLFWLPLFYSTLHPSTGYAAGPSVRRRQFLRYHTLSLPFSAFWFGCCHFVVTPDKLCSSRRSGYASQWLAECCSSSSHFRRRCLCRNCTLASLWSCNTYVVRLWVFYAGWTSS